MKVKKELFPRADEVVLGDVIAGCGAVHYTHYNVSLQKTEIVYLSDNARGLLVLRCEPYASVDIVREVEKPDRLTITSRWGSNLEFVDFEEEEPGHFVLEIPLVDRNFVLDATKMIDAIKQVKGLD